MIIYIGADHRGFKLKDDLAVFLKESGYEVGDVGNTVNDENDDYNEFAEAVAEKVSKDYENSKGVLICGSGAGTCIVANKFPKIRAVVAMTPDQAFDSKNDNDSNVICFGANYTSADEAKKILVTWLGTPFSGEERHRRRVEKIRATENTAREKANF